MRRRDVRSLSIPRSRHGRHRGDGGRLAGREDGGHDGDDGAARAGPRSTAEGGTTQRVSPARRTRCCAAGALRPMASPMPATTPRRRPPRPTTTASSSTERSTWRPAGADGPQQGELAGALGDDDRERVVDDERADEQGDQGERQQERVEDADELRKASWLSSVNSAPVIASFPGGRTSAMRAVSSSCETPSSPATEIQSNLPGSPTSAWAVAGLEQRGRGAAPVVELPEAGDPDDGEVLHPAGDRHLDRVAHGEAAVVGRLGVEHQVGRVRSAGAPSTSVQPLSVGRGQPVEPEVGRPLGRDEGLALLVEDADLGDDLALGGA